MKKKDLIGTTIRKVLSMTDTENQEHRKLILQTLERGGLRLRADELEYLGIFNYYPCNDIVISNDEKYVLGKYESARGCTSALVKLDTPRMDRTPVYQFRYFSVSCQAFILDDGEVRIRIGAEHCPDVFPEQIYDPWSGGWRDGSWPAFFEAHVKFFERNFDIPIREVKESD